MDVAKAIQEVKAGKVEFRVDKTGIIHAPVGKIEFSREQLSENAQTLIDSVIKARPAAVKGELREAHNDRFDNESRHRSGPCGSAKRRSRGSMKPKKKKEQELNALKKDLAEATNLIVAQFKGITVAQDTELREKIRGNQQQVSRSEEYACKNCRERHTV